MSDRIILGSDGRKYITNEPLLHEDKQAIELRRLHDECEALKADAARYRWLRDNLRRWSWNPDGHVYPDKVVGFAHKGTGYLDSEFQTAIDAARSKA